MSNELKEFEAQPTARKIGGGDGIGPGHVNIGGGFFDGHYPSNKCIEFRTQWRDAKADEPTETVAAQINGFFESNPGMVVTGVFHSTDSTLVFYTRILTEEEVAQFNRLNVEVRAKMDEENLKKALAEQEKLKREEEAAAEQKRLAELGRRCEENHGKKMTPAEVP